MNASDFNELNSNTKFKLVKAGLLQPHDAFEVLGKDPQRSYRQIAKIVHPDKGGDEEAFNRLGYYLTASEEEAKLGTYGIKVPQTATIEGIAYTLHRQLGSGDSCDVWLSDSDHIIKIPRDSADIDLLDTEVQHLRYMADNTLRDDHDIPEVVAIDGNGAVYHYNTEFICPPEDLVTLEKLADDYDHAIPIKAVGWLWRRIISGLMRPHALGLVHAAITPDNVLVDTVNHRIVLIDWKYTSKNESVIEFIPDRWKAIYPPQVLGKLPPDPGVDIYMAAQCMKQSFVLPVPMKDYFDALSGKWGQVPSNPQYLLSIWDTVMYEHLGWKKEFVILPHEPIEVDWSWFQS